MKSLLPLTSVLVLVGTSAFAGFASGPATPAAEAPAPVVAQTPQLDACFAYCNYRQSFFGQNMAASGTISSTCPADSVARGGSTVYELVEGLAHEE